MGLILSSFLAALRQLFHPGFRRVAVLGVTLALLLLVAVYALSLLAIVTLAPDEVQIPGLGPVPALHELLGLASLLLMIGLSVVLMVPVASAFAGLFHEDIAAAVEARHYPGLPPVAPVRLGDALVGAANFMGLVIAVNVAGIFVYPFAGPFAPLVFWAVNGLLLGREYATLVAERRLGRAAAVALWRRHRGLFTLAGALMCAPLSLPLVNLVIPLLGVATFTHLVHRLGARGA
jgi:uncharacterized protein involved in cysteine biosynthesis